LPTCSLESLVALICNFGSSNPTSVPNEQCVPLTDTTAMPAR
jgi:hypothetical protein